MVCPMHLEPHLFYFILFGIFYIDVRSRKITEKQTKHEKLDFLALPKAISN